jgi:hypothetical protein
MQSSTSARAFSFGASSSESKTLEVSDTARGSTVSAGGNVSITASGKGKDSDILIRGAEINAGQTASLSAEGDIELLAAQNTAILSGSNKSDAGSVGITLWHRWLRHQRQRQFGPGQGGRGRPDPNQHAHQRVRFEHTVFGACPEYAHLVLHAGSVQSCVARLLSLLRLAHAHRQRVRYRAFR